MAILRINLEEIANKVEIIQELGPLDVSKLHLFVYWIREQLAVFFSIKTYLIMKQILKFMDRMIKKIVINGTGEIHK